MLAPLTTLSEIAVQPVDSQIELTPSTSYLINTNNLTRIKVQGTNDSLIHVKLNRFEDRTPAFSMIVNETNANIQTYADVSASSNMLALPVFEEAASFSEATGTPVTKYINIDSISWAEQNSAATISKIWVQFGGYKLTSLFVNYNLAQIYDLLATGTTTTSTSSTSSTTTAA